MHYLITLLTLYLFSYLSITIGKSIEYQHDMKNNNEKVHRTRRSSFYGMNEVEQKIFTLINKHRENHGLSPLQPSANLAFVARTHAIDLVENNPDVNGGNMHSWSNKGNWKPVRYTTDHAQGHLMWSKPSEISNYKYDGYENSHGYGHDARKTMAIDPYRAVHGWKNSPGHNNLMIQRGGWGPMKVMGVGVYKGIANVWFGEHLDTFPAPDKANIIFGNKYQFINAASNKVLGVHDSGTHDDANVEIFKNHKGANQIWIIYRYDDGSIQLFNPHSDKALDVSGNGHADGTNVQIYTNNRSVAQRWFLKSVGDDLYELINVESGKALDVSGSGSADGTNVQIWSPNHTPAQRWRIVPI
ncbi:hypothetical protein I4U23_011138 [Adineta vaga]|nr:hypothetical protein I4U23_011138 [Adineta vaga]